MVFAIDALSYLGVVLGLLTIDPVVSGRSEPAARERGMLRAGVRYARKKPLAAGVLGLVLTQGVLVGTLTMALPTLAFGAFGGLDAYPVLATALAIGTLGMATWNTRRPKMPGIRRVIGTALALDALVVLTGLAPTLWLAAVGIAASGVALIGYIHAVNCYLQLIVADEMLGRLTGLYFLLVNLGTLVNGPMLGWLGAVHPRAASLVGGGLALVLTLAAMPVLLRAGAGHDPTDTSSGVVPR